MTVKYEDSENDNENYKPTCGKSGKGSCILFKKIVGTGSGISIIIYVCGVLAQFKFFFSFCSVSSSFVTGWKISIQAVWGVATG